MFYCPRCGEKMDEQPCPEVDKDEDQICDEECPNGHVFHVEIDKQIDLVRMEQLFVAHAQMG